jgi:hypothetical protein
MQLRILSRNCGCTQLSQLERCLIVTKYTWPNKNYQKWEVNWLFYTVAILRRDNESKTFSATGR